jgi:hypothetical protein
MARLEQSKFLNRPLRTDDWPELGVSTLAKLLEAIDAGRKEEARTLAQYLTTELLQMHDYFALWLWSFFTSLAKRPDETELSKFYEEIGYGGPLLDAFASMGLEEYVRWFAELMRGHGSGPERSGNIVVRDEGDKYVIESDPCGSGGWMRRLAAGNSGLDYLLVVKKAYPWTWGKTDVPAYCTHCAALEIGSIQKYGYPVVVTEYRDDPSQPCRYVFYKDPEAIPDHYFTRVGQSKPSPAA